MNTSSGLAVAIPTYNRAEMLNQALSSLCAQTFKQFKVYILDNCSDDQTHEIIDCFRDRLDLCCIKQQSNIGPEQNFRAAFKCLQYYDFGFVMADDDHISPRFFERGMSFLGSNKDFSYYYGGFISADSLVLSNGKYVNREQAYEQSYAQPSADKRLIAYARDVMHNHVYYSLYRNPHFPKFSRTIGSDHMDVMYRLARSKIFCDSEVYLVKDCSNWSSQEMIARSDLQIARTAYLGNIPYQALGNHLEIKIYDFYLNALQVGLAFLSPRDLSEFIRTYMKRFFGWLDEQVLIEIIVSQSLKRSELKIFQTVLPKEAIISHARSTLAK